MYGHFIKIEVVFFTKIVCFLNICNIINIQWQYYPFLRQGNFLGFVTLPLSPYRHDVTKVGDFYNGGLWANYLSFVGSSWNFVPGYIKNVDTHPESFSSKKQVIKAVITKKPMTNLYEMNSNQCALSQK